MAVWDGLLFGMLLQLSVGPVCIAVLQRAVTYGFRQAWWMAAGVAAVDAAYMAAAMGGLALVLQIPLVKNLVVIGGAVALVWFGIGCMRAKAPQMEGVLAGGGAAGHGEAASLPMAAGTARGREAGTEIPTGKARASFWYGAVLTMTNPLTIVFWAGVFGSLLSSTSFADRAELLWFAAGCVLSTLLFLTAVSVLGRQAARVLRPVWLKRLNIAVGLFLIGFAIRLFLQNTWFY